MTRRKVAPAPFNLTAIIQRPVKVTKNGTETTMQPFEAQFEQCAMAALKGDIRACVRFINWCLRERLIEPIEPFDDHQYFVVIPKDWGYDEFMANYNRYGPPPWPGERDGLTDAGRDERKQAALLRRRAAR